MPVKITKTGPGKYRVSTPSGVKAKGTTMMNAMAQKRIIESADHKKMKSKVPPRFYAEA